MSSTTQNKNDVLEDITIGDDITLIINGLRYPQKPIDAAFEGFSSDYFGYKNGRQPRFIIRDPKTNAIYSLLFYKRDIVRKGFRTLEVTPRPDSLINVRIYSLPSKEWSKRDAMLRRAYSAK